MKVLEILDKILGSLVLLLYILMLHWEWAIVEQTGFSQIRLVLSQLRDPL
jgi:hypothetical protein